MGLTQGVAETEQPSSKRINVFRWKTRRGNRVLRVLANTVGGWIGGVEERQAGSKDTTEGPPAENPPPRPAPACIVCCYNGERKAQGICTARCPFVHFAATALLLLFVLLKFQ